MKHVPYMLFAPLVLVSCTSASNPSALEVITEGITRLNLKDPSNSFETPQIPRIVAPGPKAILEKIDNPESSLESGKALRRELLCDIKTMNNMDEIVETLEEIIKHKISQENIGKVDKMTGKEYYPSISVFLHGFFENSDPTKMDKFRMTKTAMKNNATNLLRYLQYSDYWDSVEQSLWFLIKVYIAGHLSNDAMEKDQRYLNWYLMHDNPNLFPQTLLKAALDKQNVLETPHPLGNDFAHFMILKFDLYEPTSQLSPRLLKDATKDIKVLAESGSFKLLRFLVESHSINLHLEDYTFPDKLPKDITEFRFFWAQGYRYTSPPLILWVACKCGRLDIIEFLYWKSSAIIEPKDNHLCLAASNGHWNILEWAIEKKLGYSGLGGIRRNLVINGHLKALKKIWKKLNLPHSEAFEMSNLAAQSDQFDIVKWFWDVFGIVPGPYYLSRTSIEILELVESVSFQTIEHRELVNNASLEVLKWISKKHPNLLAADKKSFHFCSSLTIEKVEWLHSKGWDLTQNFDYDWYICEYDFKVLKFGYEKLGMEPTWNRAIIAAGNGYTGILKSFYSHSNGLSCIGKDTLLKAIEHGHFGTAKYLESLLNLKGQALKPNLEKAASTGNLEFIVWVYQNYLFGELPYYKWLTKAIEHGHLHIVNWALEKGFISEGDDAYLEEAARCGHYLIFKRLLEYGVFITDIEYFIDSSPAPDDLKIMKLFVEKYPKGAQFAKKLRPHCTNYHIVQWFWDQDCYFKKIDISYAYEWLSYQGQDVLQRFSYAS